ncbi:TrbC family F-type conjugative pilus assembly protein [Pseudoalteromonas sp. T1lg23B]|uniref:TrbC family F-type conjugative pilus assembly protein n=1 Tax=Pseudoalteromonas sp. T1lg23B TaxID=2077097 RepID=UPI000CF5DC47|nr:TrbC family F-type conjugative pilus assembly protein [Pseudoalteromonas sp. T1lg23B]
MLFFRTLLLLLASGCALAQSDPAPSTDTVSAKILETGAVDIKNKYQINEMDKDIVKRMNRLFEHLDQGNVPKHLQGLDLDALKNNPYQEQAKQITQAQQHNDKQQDALNALAKGTGMEDIVAQYHDDQVDEARVSATKSEDQITYFISFDMPKKILKELLLVASEDKTARVVVRGIRPGMKSIYEMVQFVEGYLQTLKANRDIKNIPIVELDNTVFIEHDIYAVPSIVYHYQGKVVRVEGFTNKQYIKERLLAGETDLGRVSEVYDIGEPDLKETLAKVLEQQDWEAKKRKVMATYWQKYNFYETDHALESDSYYVDPSVTVTQTVRAPNGQVLLHKGQKINPLLALNKQVTTIIFDATSSAQVHWVKQFISQQTQGELLLLTTKIDKDKGWEAWSELLRTFEQNVYLLNEQVIKRFAIKAVPSVVTQQRALLKVDVIGREQWGNL